MKPTSTVGPEMGSVLRAAREGAGITRYRLAKQAEVSQTHLARFEGGERPISRVKYEHLQAALAALIPDGIAS